MIQRSYNLLYLPDTVQKGHANTITLGGAATTGIALVGIPASSIAVQKGETRKGVLSHVM
jgi:hypothetical protein